MCIDTLIQQLCCTHRLDQAQWAALLRGAGAQEAEHLAQAAQAEAVARFGKKIYVRGLIEFTNYCRNDCYYCGIRRSNAKAQRYRLTPEDIFACCAEGYDLGFRTIVLQGGEDAGFPTICSAKQWKQSKNAGATVHLPSPWANATGRLSILFRCWCGPLSAAP